MGRILKSPKGFGSILPAKQFTKESGLYQMIMARYARLYVESFRIGAELYDMVLPGLESEGGIKL